jgi:hypothetical protein
MGEGGTEPADDHTFVYGNGNADRHLGKGLLVPKGIESAVKSVEFVIDRMSYLLLRGIGVTLFRMCILCTVTEDKNDYTTGNLQ